jgi:hypothetical protein
MAAPLPAAVIAAKIDPQSYPNGRFARLHDPEGNPIDLWQLARPDVPREVAKQFRTVCGFSSITAYSEAVSFGRYH